MTYSKLGNIKGPQGRRGINMTGGATTPPTVDDNVLEGDLWLDSTTGDVYRATDPWTKDGTWNTWGTVLWKVVDDGLMVQPAEGDTGTLGREPWGEDGWGNSSNNPSMASITSVRSKGEIAVNAGSTSLFDSYASLTDISPISGWDTSGVTYMNLMFSGCTSLTDISPISDWNVSGVTDMGYMFNQCPLERIGIPSLEHGGRKFVSNLNTASVVTNMNTTMLTNTTTGETMSAKQMLTDMDTNPSKYATGTIWTIARA